jgi:hypothetical protein
MSTSCSVPDLVPALDRPTPTADRKIAAFQERLAQRGGMRGIVDDAPTRVTIPGLDIAALSCQYGMDEAIKPHWLEGTFQAPLQATWPQYERIRDEALKRFISITTKRGWDLLVSNDYRPRVSPGVYPARDLHSGFLILDRREFVIGCWFTFRQPKPLRIEIPPSWREPLTIRG